MAFNPFNFFRKNQKILFALLTIMVMFMFVLSSGIGRGDFFQWFPEWLGQQRGPGGEAVAVVEGKKLTTGQLSNISQKRNRANEFLMSLSAHVSNKIAKQLDDSISKADRESGQDKFRTLLQSRQMGYLGQQEYFQILMAQQQGQQIPPSAVLNARFTEINRQFQTLDAMVSSQLSKPEEKELARTAKVMVDIDSRRMFSPTYFSTIPIKETKDSYEFELWKRKADKLGITISSIDAEFMVYSELGAQANETDWKQIQNELQSRDARLTTESLKQAIADEFRVRTAMAAIIGNTNSRNGADIGGDQSAASPYQVYQYYRQQCDESMYSVLGIPAENFIKDVKGEPTEAELRELFAKYRVQEPNPVLERPGFKEPRKLKLEWLQAKGDEKYYEAGAKDAFIKTELQAKLAGLTIAPVDPISVVSVLAGPALLSIKPENVLESVYNSYKTGSEFNIRSSWDVNFLNTRADVTDPSVVKATNLAALTSVVASSLMGFGPPSTGPIVMIERARMEERNAKARAQAAAFVLPILGHIPMGNAIALAARIPEPLPLAVLRPEAEKKVKERLARQLCYNDLEKFQTELAKLGKGVDKSGARDYLEKFVKDRGFTKGESKEFRDQFSIYGDAGLTPLLEIFNKRAGKDANPIGFGQLFFFEQDERRQNRPAATYYAPNSYPPGSLNEQAFVGTQLADAPTEPVVLAWRTAEEAAVEPKNMDDAKVRAKVVAAWKRAKARELAKTKAEEIAKTAKDFGTHADAIRGKLIDLEAELKATAGEKAAMDRIKYFEIADVAPIVTGQAFMPGRSSWTDFQYMPNKDAPYATGEMTNELLKNRDKAPGTAFVMTDNPKDMYYVAVLSNRNVRTAFDFSRGIYAPLSALNQQDLGSAIRGRFQSDASSKARETALNLLKAEFKVENENAKLLAEKTDTGA